MWWVGPSEKVGYYMSDIKQAGAMLRMANRDLTALRGMAFLLARAEAAIAALK